MTMRYWEKLSDLVPGGVSRVFRLDEETRAVEKYWQKSWVDAFDWWESIVMEPDFVEIDEKEAKALLTQFN